MSPVIKPSEPSTQLTLSFTPGLTQRFRHVRDAVAQGVYQRGLKNVAGDMDIAPGNLSVALADDTQRKFGVDERERYVQVTGDLTPIYYLVERYLGDQAAAREQAMQQVADMLQHLPELMAVAGLAKKKR
jgi:hypothetical protein